MLNKIYSYLKAFYKHLQKTFATGGPEYATATNRRDRRQLESQVKPELQAKYCKPRFSKTLIKKLRK